MLDPSAINPPHLLLEELRRLLLYLERAVQSSRGGAHRSRLLGGGGAFAEFAEYRPGDELRRIDWKVAARTDRLVVRRHESERATDVHVILDCSGSMNFGTTGEVDAPWGGCQPASKWELARLVGLLLCFVARRRGDGARLSLLAGDPGMPGLRVSGRGLGGVLGLAEQLAASSPGGRLSDLQALEGQRGRPADRALVVLVSDLLDELDVLDRLVELRAAGAEVWVLQILDPAELDFPYEEPTRFVGLESGDELAMNPRDFAEAVRSEMAAFCSSREASCQAAGIRYALLRADRSWERMLFSLIEGS